MMDRLWFSVHPLMCLIAHFNLQTRQSMKTWVFWKVMLHWWVNSYTFWMIILPSSSGSSSPMRVRNYLPRAQHNKTWTFSNTAVQTSNLTPKWLRQSLIWGSNKFICPGLRDWEPYFNSGTWCHLKTGNLNLPWGWQLYFSSRLCCKC